MAIFFFTTYTMSILSLEIGNVLFGTLNVHSALCGTHAAAVFVSLLLLHVAALHILKERRGRAGSAGKPNYTKRAENNTTNITKILICELRKSRQIEVHILMGKTEHKNTVWKKIKD